MNPLIRTRVPHYYHCDHCRVNWLYFRVGDLAISLSVSPPPPSPPTHLNLQFTELMEVLGDMLSQIDRQRRSKMIDEAVDMATGDHHEPVR